MNNFRSAQGPRTGNIKLKNGSFGYMTPRVVAVLKDPRLAEFYAARLRGEPVQLPRNRPCNSK